MTSAESTLNPLKGDFQSLKNEKDYKETYIFSFKSSNRVNHARIKFAIGIYNRVPNPEDSNRSIYT